MFILKHTALRECQILFILKHTALRVCNRLGSTDYLKSYSLDMKTTDSLVVFYSGWFFWFFQKFLKPKSNEKTQQKISNRLGIQIFICSCKRIMTLSYLWRMMDLKHFNCPLPTILCSVILVKGRQSSKTGLCFFYKIVSLGQFHYLL